MFWKKKIRGFRLRPKISPSNERKERGCTTQNRENSTKTEGREKKEGN